MADFAGAGVKRTAVTSDARWVPSTRSAPGPLGLPAFRRLAAAYTANQVADWLVEVAVALAVFDRTGSALASALVFLVLRVLPAAAAPLLAARAARAGAGRWLMKLSAARALVVLGLALGVHELPLPLLLALGLADGLPSLAGRSGSRATAAWMLGGAERVRAGNAVLNVLFSIAAAGSPAAAGLLVAHYGPGAALGVAAALLAGSAACVTRLTGVGERRSHLPRPDGSLRRVLAHAPLARLLALEAALLVLFTAAVPIEVPYAKQALAAGDGGYGVLLGAWGAGMVAGSLAFAALRRSPLPLLAAAATVSVALAYALMGIAASLPLACAGALLGGAGNGVQWVAVVSWAQRIAPAGLELPLLALLESLAAIAPGAGFMLGGAALIVLAPRAALVATGGALGVAALTGAALFAVRRPAGRDAPAPLAAEAG